MAVSIWLSSVSSESNSWTGYRQWSSMNSSASNHWDFSHCRDRTPQTSIYRAHANNACSNVDREYRQRLHSNVGVVGGHRPAQQARGAQDRHCRMPWFGNGNRSDAGGRGLTTDGGGLPMVPEPAVNDQLAICSGTTSNHWQRR